MVRVPKDGSAPVDALPRDLTFGYVQRMGYRNHPSWRDMSDYVSHFTKDSQGLSAYAAMLSILASGRIRAFNSFGCATNVTGLEATQTCACFSEIPLDMLDRLVARRSRYGIGFHQLTLIPKGASRVWYLDPATPTRAAVNGLVRTAMTGGVDLNDDIWRLTPFADNVADNYHFEWEREWRVVGDLAFAPEDVAFLFIPGEQHDDARAFLVDGGRGAGPAYNCPLLDPLWTDEQLQEVLRRFVPDQP